MPEGVGAPGAKSPRDSVLRDLAVQISRKRSPGAETRVPHRLHAGDEKPDSGEVKDPEDSYILCCLWDSHLERAAKTCPGVSYGSRRALLLCPSSVHPLAHKQSSGWGEQLCSQPHTSDGSR